MTTSSASVSGPKTAEELEKIEAQLDPEMRFRALLPMAGLLVGGLLFALSAFHYWTAGFGLLPEQLHRGIHLAFVLGLVFLVFPASTATSFGFSHLGIKHVVLAALFLVIVLMGPFRLADFARMTHEHWLLIAAAVVVLGGSFLTSRGGEPTSGVWRPLGISLFDWLMMLAAVVTSLYVPWIFHDLVFRVGNPLTIDWVMGSIMIVLLLEATRRSVGAPLPIIAMVLIVYALYGPSLPGILAHPGNSWKSVVNHLYLTSNGIFGVALGVVATYVFHYVLFGVLATRIGLGKLFLDLSTAAAGRYSGGPAKVSIFGSGLFGMISGSSIANTVTVGSLTIPMMIRIGYPRHFAAAVESTAATGGQITPPIMGAAAFLMVEYLSVPYQTVILAAIVPAFMHFFGVFCQVHFEAKKLGMRGVPSSELPSVRRVLAQGWPTLIPLVVLLVILFSGYTPYLAAFWGITTCLVIGITHGNPYVAVALLAAIGLEVKLDLIVEWAGLIPLFGGCLAVCVWSVAKTADGKKNLLMVADAFVVGAKYAISVGAAAATVGIIVGIVTLTGVGFKLSDIVTSFAAQMAAQAGSVLPSFLFNAAGLTLFFTLVMTALVCLLLGCGIPTTANYIIMVTIAQPALAKLGVAPIVSHFFVFYYGLLADITPPVALAAYAGASMAGADPFKTGNTAFRLGMAKALVPFVFVYSPAMLIVTNEFTWPLFVETVAGCLVGIVLLAMALTGFGLAMMVRWQRLVLFAASILVIAPSRTATIIGLLLAVPILVHQFALYKSGRGQPVLMPVRSG
jgi:TRAP transporter 4TM/12TM fusion protein